MEANLKCHILVFEGFTFAVFGARIFFKFGFIIEISIVVGMRFLFVGVWSLSPPKEWCSCGNSAFLKSFFGLRSESFVRSYLQVTV